MKRITRLGLVLAVVLGAQTGVLAKPPEGKGPGSGGGGGGGGEDPTVVDHKARQAAPIKLGTSGGWQYDLANGYCCGGTLGALVTDGTDQFILSNFHVLAADTEPGGNGRTAALGDPVIQPGLIDVRCDAAQAQLVARLAGYGDPMQGANIDAALAKVEPGAVSAVGEILGVGVLSVNTVGASFRQRVKKSGRTTGLTSSRVDGLNATVQVAYDTECAGASRGVAVFTGQILVSNRGSKFLAGGDSGSLVVEDVATEPRAVGLLFAGSSSIAVANPIDEVLSVLGVTMVGQGALAGTTGEVPAGIDSTVLPKGLARAAAAQAAHGHALQRIPGSVGHAIGSIGGAAVVQLLVEVATPELRANAPRHLDGVPVVVREVGHIVAF